MPLPTPDKTWQYDPNRAMPQQADALASNRKILRQIKTTLIGFGSQPWTVRGSSDSVAAGMDAVDRWDSDTDLVWANAGVAHSWIVLRQTGISATFEICIDLITASANGSDGEIFASTAGFTGGSTTARPTAADEARIGQDLVTISGTNSDGVLHVMQSTDGQCTRVVLYKANNAVMFWMFDKPKNPVTGWSNPYVGIVRSNTGSSIMLVTELMGTANAQGRGSATFNMTLTSENTGTGANSQIPTAQTFANDFSGEFPLLPIGLYSTTASHRGRHGMLFDMWWGLVSNADADGYPNDGSRQFIQMGDLVVKWNGSVLVTA